MVLKRKEKQMLKQNLDGKYPERIKIPVKKGSTIISLERLNGFSDQRFETDAFESEFIGASFVKQQGSYLVYVTDLMYPWEYFESNKISRNFTPKDRDHICSLWFDCDDVKDARNIDKSDLVSMTKEQIYTPEPYWLNSKKDERLGFFHHYEGVEQDRYEEYKEHKLVPFVDDKGRPNYKVVEVDLAGDDPQLASLRAVLYLEPKNIQTYKAQ